MPPSGFERVEALLTGRSVAFQVLRHKPVYTGQPSARGRGSPGVLRGMNKRFQPGELPQISERLAAHGIRRLGFLLLGGPGETRQSIDESLDFARSPGLEMLKVCAGIRLYPRTPLARLAVEEGAVSPDDDLLMPRFYVRPGLKDYLREIQQET
jgi:hypothetical protein